jgi:SAM-dependent methyltransferase
MRCRNWEEWNVQEWQLRSRETPEGLLDFYHTTESWAFDLMWYAYLQAEGYRYPVSVAVADSIGSTRTGTTHLDFGSGVGVTGQLFSRLGYTSTLADISTSLLGFARFRLERRGSAPDLIDLNTTALGADQYDVITAIDTLVHIPNLEDTMSMLHRALRPSGLLFANFDVRPKSIENAAHLYSDDRPLRWQLQRVGFEPEESLDGMITRYRRVEPTGLLHQARGVRDAVLLRSPLRAAYRALRNKLPSSATIVPPQACARPQGQQVL